MEGKINIFDKPDDDQQIGLHRYISPLDIKQGGLGSCFFLACLSAMAEYPNRILNLFVTKKVNKYGIYCVKFCVNGKWKAIIVDDFIPCLKDKKPCFSQAVGNELWVMLLEKAYAKLVGGYFVVDGGGQCYNAFKILTGAPSYR